MLTTLLIFVLLSRRVSVNQVINTEVHLAPGEHSCALRLHSYHLISFRAEVSVNSVGELYIGMYSICQGKQVDVFRACFRVVLRLIFLT